MRQLLSMIGTAIRRTDSGFEIKMPKVMKCVPFLPTIVCHFNWSSLRLLPYLLFLSIEVFSDGKGQLQYYSSQHIDH